MRSALQLPETERLKLKWSGSSLNSYHWSGLSTMYVLILNHSLDGPCTRQKYLVTENEAHLLDQRLLLGSAGPPTSLSG